MLQSLHIDNYALISHLELNLSQGMTVITGETGAGKSIIMGAITGAIAEAYYGGVPEHIKVEVLKRLPDEFIDVMTRFYQRFVEK